MANQKLGVMLIRGTIGLNKEKKDTLKMLNIEYKYNLAIINDTPVTKGMIQKVKDYITWGTITEETIKELDEKRPKGERKYYRLHPPRGGLERKGSKKNYKDGGALGDRKEKINDLIKRML